MFIKQRSARQAEVEESGSRFQRVKSALLCLPFLILAIAAAFAAETAVAQAPAVSASATLSDILEQAAFQQDTANDPERAIKLYRQVIESGRATREMTAQALYNTGLCHAKLKRGSEADQAFGRRHAIQGCRAVLPSGECAIESIVLADLATVAGRRTSAI